MQAPEQRDVPAVAGLAMHEAARPTVETAAAETIVVERTLQQPEPPNAAFERRFAGSRSLFAGWNPGPNAIRHHRFADAVLDGEFRCVLTDAGYVEGTGYLVPDHVLGDLRVDGSRTVRFDDDANVVIGCNEAHTNYFHWISQALPAIDCAWHRQGQASMPKVALPPLNGWQRDSLELLGLRGLQIVTLDDKDRQYRFRSLEFSEILNNGAAFCLSETTRATYERLRRAVGPPAGSASRIYVARTDASSRRMRNEVELIAALAERGFRIVVPGAMSFAEQARVFRDAALVVGAHGAGLTNFVFCEPGTVVYELVPAHYGNCCFCNLGLICRLNYWADAFESEGDEAPPNLRDWESDTAAIIRRVGEIEAVMQEGRSSDASARRAQRDPAWRRALWAGHVHYVSSRDEPVIGT